MLLYFTAMDEQDKKTLQSLLRIEHENHAMLKKLVAFNHRALLVKIIYWIVIIGTAVGIFSFLRPYLDSIEALYTTSVSGVSSAIHLIQ